MIATLLIGIVIGAIIMFIAIRNGYIKIHKN